MGIRHSLQFDQKQTPLPCFSLQNVILLFWGKEQYSPSPSSSSRASSIQTKGVQKTKQKMRIEIDSFFASPTKETKLSCPVGYEEIEWKTAGVHFLLDLVRSVFQYEAQNCGYKCQKLVPMFGSEPTFNLKECDDLIWSDLNNRCRIENRLVPAVTSFPVFLKWLGSFFFFSSLSG